MIMFAARYSTLLATPPSNINLLTREMRTMSDHQLPSPDQIRDFVIAGHGNLQKTQAMLSEYPTLLNVAYQWKENDLETAIQGAAHIGNAVIAGFLLAQGAPLEICTAAMLGQIKDVEQLLQEDPDLIHTTGAHGIPLLTHAALSGNIALIQLLVQQGAHTGFSAALHNAVSKGHEAMVRWCLENGQPDLGWQNFEGQTALTVAKQRESETIIQLLQAWGATE